MPQPLQNKISIVTGASRGIGRGIAVRLAAAGSSVVLCARDQALLDELHIARLSPERFVASLFDEEEG